MTQIRLAWGGPPDAAARGLGEPPLTTVRLVHNPSGRLRRAQQDQPELQEDEDMTTVRLAVDAAAASGKRAATALAPGAEPESRPALLVSYFYLSSFEKQRHRYAFRTWSMDSGAYSAANSGKPIAIEAYHETCLRLLAEDPQLVEMFALDVLGDWRASIRNVERAWEAGIPAMPTFHVGEPEHVLKHYAANYPKIALGGAVRYSKRLEWAKQCFARVWPKPIHGLGFGARPAVLALPWHSVDASNWEIRATAFGVWSRYGMLSVRGGDQNLRGEVEWHLELERAARMKWSREMRALDAELAEAGWRGVSQ